MSFADYAFFDVTEYLDQNPSHHFGTVAYITRREDIEFRQQKTFKPRPRFKDTAIDSLSAFEIAEFDPLLLESVIEGKVRNGTILSANVLLPALYCTIAEQMCMRGRAVNLMIRDPLSGAIAKIELKADQFPTSGVVQTDAKPDRPRSHREKRPSNSKAGEVSVPDAILRSAHAFYKPLFKRVHNPDRLCIYVFFRPLALH